MLQLWVILDSNNKPKSLSLTPIAVKPAPPNLAPASDQPAGLTFTAWAGCLGTAHLCSAWTTSGRQGARGGLLPPASPGPLGLLRTRFQEPEVDRPGGRNPPPCFRSGVHRAQTQREDRQSLRATFQTRILAVDPPNGGVFLVCARGTLVNTNRFM